MLHAQKLHQSSRLHASRHRWNRLDSIERRLSDRLKNIRQAKLEHEARTNNILRYGDHASGWSNE